MSQAREEIRSTFCKGRAITSIFKYFFKSKLSSALRERPRLFFLVSASHVTAVCVIHSICFMCYSETCWCIFAAVSPRPSPELGDIQWNETATSDSMIVTLLFLLLLKKLYTFHSRSKCVMISERAKKRERAREAGWRERGHTVCMHTHRCMCVCILCMW